MWREGEQVPKHMKQTSSAVAFAAAKRDANTAGIQFARVQGTHTTTTPKHNNEDEEVDRW